MGNPADPGQGPPHLMLLPYELGEFTVAPDRILRQTRARPLDQGEIILVDRGGWHLGKTGLMEKGLLVGNEQARPDPFLEGPSLPTALDPAPASFPKEKSDA